MPALPMTAAQREPVPRGLTQLTGLLQELDAFLQVALGGGRVPGQPARRP